MKIFILAGFSNAMNPWEVPPVPSLRRAIVPGLHARLCSASLGLQWLGQTWIISWPDYSGLLGLTVIIWPLLPVLMVQGPCLQTGNQNPFTSHFDWFGIYLPEPVQDHSSHFSYFHHKRSQDLPNFQDILGCSAYQVTKIWIDRSNPGPNFSFVNFHL